MNFLHAKLITRTGSGRGRGGLSIIEVLTSIVVAMIGVFGVMILIPFAVKQARTGLDSDASVVTAQNAYAQFEIAGYRTPTNWAIHRGGAVVTAYSPFGNADTTGDGVADSPPDPPQIFSIDPLGLTENGATTIAASYANAVFPFNPRQAGTTSYPNNLVITPVNLGTPTGAIMGQEVARRMFRSADDLIFADAADELLGPEQVFDQGNTGFLRRQAIGRLSWSAIVVPFKTDPLSMSTTRWSYKMYILVYKARQTLINAMPDPEDQMSFAQLDASLNSGTHRPVSNVFLESSVASVQGVVNRDDWVMLINRTPPAEPGFDRHVAFYRVVNTSDANGTNPTSVTLDGPDFTFSGAGPIGPTFIVHLKNVVGVYERTFEPENESNWTN